jgi:hypothetical protein
MLAFEAPIRHSDDRHGKLPLTASGSSMTEVTLDNTLTDFLAGPVAINVASHDAALLPSVARGFGCRVSADGRRITAFLSVRSAEAVLRDLRAGAPVAVVFSRPQTHATLQFKGIGAAILPLAPGDREIMRAYGEAFRTEITALGYDDDFASKFVAPANDDAVAVEFTPNAVYEQTPGPEAGKPLPVRR